MGKEFERIFLVTEDENKQIILWEYAHNGDDTLGKSILFFEREGGAL